MVRIGEPVAGLDAMRDAVVALACMTAAADRITTAEVFDALARPPRRRRHVRPRPLGS